MILFEALCKKCVAIKNFNFLVFFSYFFVVRRKKGTRDEKKEHATKYRLIFQSSAFRQGRDYSLLVGDRIHKECR